MFCVAVNYDYYPKTGQFYRSGGKMNIIGAKRRPGDFLLA
jgi:hypothetical protein